MVKTKVSVEKCNDYSSKKVRDCILKSLKNINYDLKNFNGKKVLVKPNLVSGHKPETGVVTDYRFVEEICKILNENKVKEIIIGESSALNTDVAFEVSGFNKLKKYAEIINFEGENKKFLDIGVSRWKKVRVPVTKLVFDCDLVINVAKLKTHSLTQITLCTKNLYGCVPGKVKENLHKEIIDSRNFSKFISLLGEKINPELNFIDGILGLEGEGPGASGVPFKSKIVLASSCHKAIDFVGSELMGFNANKIFINKFNNVLKKNLEVLGSGKDVKYNFKKPSTHITGVFFWLIKLFPKPKIFSQDCKCKRCGICVKKCPVNALSLNPNAICDHKKCIKCLCCLEVCPYEAIYLRESWPRRFFMWFIQKFRKV